MASAVFTIDFASFAVSFVIEGQMVSSFNFVDVKVDLCVANVLVIEINRHEEFAVITIDRANLFPRKVCPKRRFVRVFAVVCFFSPRISHLHKLEVLAFLIFKLKHAQDSVSMSLCESYLSLSLVISAHGATLNDVVICVGGLKGFPKRFYANIFVIYLFPRGAVECSDSFRWATTNDVLVIAIVLGKGFLKDGAIDRFIMSSLSIQSLIVAVSHFHKWEVVVDNHCMRDAEGVELYSVDAVLA